MHLPLRTAFLALFALAPAAQQPPGDRALRHEPELVHVTALDVDLRVDGPTMRVEQRVTLHNSDVRPREFDLIFPLGDGSVVSGLALHTADGTLEGTVHGADEARRIYQSIVRRTKDPALLEHYGEAMFRARVFPVPARGSVDVVITYTRVVEPEADRMRLHLPLTAFRRSAAATRLTIDGEIVADHPITTLYSPTHELDQGTTREHGASPVRYRSTFRVDETSAVCALDFLAYFKARPVGSESLLDVTLLSERPDPSEDGYFLAVVNGIPTESIEPEPKDVVFVLDRSGSMQDKKIEQAREALRFMLERLRPEDRFNLVTYSTGVELFAAQLQPPTAQNLADARAFLDGVRAEGGTNIEEALVQALAQLPAAPRLAQLVFLTDGLPTVGERDELALCRAAREANKGDVRIVAFGVGFDVNAALLDRLAVQSRGLSEYVLPSESIEAKVPGFYARMQAPLVLDATIAFEGVTTYDVFPRETGDLYGGHQLLVSGRYRGSGHGAVRIAGRRGGQPFAAHFPAHFAADARTGSRDLVARIWAAKKVGFLVDEIRLHGKAQELVDEIVRLGTRFGILTEYTSFLAAPETDLLAFDDVRVRALHELEERADEVTGPAAVSGAANSKRRQRVARAEVDNRYYDESGELVTIGGVQSVRGKTFFVRDGVWSEADLDATQVDEEIELFSDVYFALLDAHPWLGPVLARTGEVVLEVGGRTVRVAGSAVR